MIKKSDTLFELNCKDYSEYCGVDEAGRGPIAGPLIIVGVVLKKDIKGLRDSKKLTPKQREDLYIKIKNSANYYIYEASSKKIDEIGLSRVIKDGLESIKNHFKDRKVVFDGNSSFGVKDIEYVVKGDDKIDSIKAASIIAKVHRDNLMLEYDKIYPEYGFRNHKGYGTKAHLEAISKYGYCKIHRRSFKIKLLTTQSHLQIL